MICESCKAAGEANADGREREARLHHSVCSNGSSNMLGTWCDCHHYTGGGWTANELPNASVEGVVELAAPREPVREGGVASYAIPS